MGKIRVQGVGRMNKKALFFTLDSLFAILLAASFFVYLNYYYAETSPAVTPVDLITMSNDALAVLEKSDALSQSVRLMTPSLLQAYLNAMPVQVCANISIYSHAGINLLNAARAGCTSGGELSIARRVFIYHSEPYLAKMEAWYHVS